MKVLALLAMAALFAPETPAPPASPRTILERRFTEARIRPEWKPKLDKIIFGILRDEDRYRTIEGMRRNGVPWFIVSGLHERESSRRWDKHLHEGSPLRFRTKYIPKGRPLHPDPPYTFEQSAEDALYKLKDLENRVDWSSLDRTLNAVEEYNGTGYRRYHPEVPSPYLWSGTDLYERGKYVADGKFSRTAVDAQPGVAALWKRMLEIGALD